MTAWYVIAMLMFPWSTSPKLVINMALKFNSYELCNGYVESYKESLEGGLKRGFPEVIETEIRCVDAHTALELQQNFEEREKQL